MRFERWIDASADRLDKGVTRRYDESRPFRFTAKRIFTAAGVGMPIGGPLLAERGHRTAAPWRGDFGRRRPCGKAAMYFCILEEKMNQKLFTRNFVFLILGQASSLMGNFTLKFALSMYVLEQTGSASVFAGLLAVALLPTILLSPFGGILADRANRRSIMVALDTLCGLCVLLAGFVLPFGHDVLVIGALLTTLSVLGAFESPTVQACIPQMLSGDNIVKGNAVVGQVAAMASLLTPFLGSVLYTALGIQPIFYAAVFCFFLTAFLECFIRLDFKKPKQKRKAGAVVKQDFARSMHFLCQEQPDILKLLFLAASVSLFVAGTAVVGFPYLVRTVLGLSAGHYGAAESAMGIAAILGSLCAALWTKKLRLRYLSVVFLSFGLCLVPCGIVFLAPTGVFTRYIVLLLMFCVCQFGCSIFSTYAISLIQGRTPEHLMGKVMACVFTLSMCAQPLGQLIYGALFDAFSARVHCVLLPSGILVCGIGLASAGFFKKLEKQEASVPIGRPDEKNVPDESFTNTEKAKNRTAGSATQETRETRAEAAKL